MRRENRAIDGVARSLFNFSECRLAREVSLRGLRVNAGINFPKLHARGGILLIISIRCCRVLQSFKNHPK